MSPCHGEGHGFESRTSRMKKLQDIDLYELGNQIMIGGVILQGNGQTLALYFPESDLDNPEIVEMTHEDWKTLLFQLDTLETKLYPNNPNAKVIVRKSQRLIESGVSWKVFKRDNYTCRYCADNDTPLTVDHLVLWEDMGQSVEDNLITACRKCNKTRGNMDFEDWIETDFYKKRIQNFPDPIAAHAYNLSIWGKAKVLPLRTTKRNR